MAPTLDVGFSVDAFTVPDRQIDDLHIEMRRAKNQVEIAEGIEVAEIGAVVRDHLILGAAQDFCSAKRVFNALPQQPGKREAKELIAQEVEEPHRATFHRINQADAVYKLAAAGSPGIVEMRQVLRRNGQIRVQDHQNVALSLGKSEAYGVSLTFPGLPVKLRRTSRA